MNAQSFNFDVGVKSYKKNRLIVNEIHLLNEILFCMEKTNKTIFNISVISYVNDDSNKLKNFFDVKRDLSASNFEKVFNYYINKKGNLVTDVELGDESYFFEGPDNKVNVTVCLSGTKKHPSNNSSATKIYNFDQLKTLNKILKTFRQNTENVLYNNLEISSEIIKLSGSGFDINQFVKERGLNE